MCVGWTWLWSLAFVLKGLYLHLYLYNTAVRRARAIAVRVASLASSTSPTCADRREGGGAITPSSPKSSISFRRLRAASSRGNGRTPCNSWPIRATTNQSV